MRFKISMSLDGFVAGPDQSVDYPPGICGMRLHEWIFPLTVWRAIRGLQDGEVNESSRGVEAALEQARRAAPAVTHLKFARRRGSRAGNMGN